MTRLRVKRAPAAVCRRRTRSSGAGSTAEKSSPPSKGRSSATQPRAVGKNCDVLMSGRTTRVTHSRPQTGAELRPQHMQVGCWVDSMVRRPYGLATRRP